MADKESVGLEALWRKEDWLAVWIGFLIILLVIAGLRPVLPKLKWATDGEFTSLAAKSAPIVDQLLKPAEAAGETSLLQSLQKLSSVLAGGDRAAVGSAAKAVEEAAKSVKDAKLKKKAADLAKDIKTNAGNLPGKVFSADNLGLVLILFAAYLVFSLFAMAFMRERVAAFAVGFPVVFLIAWLGLIIAGNNTVTYYGLEYVIWCLALGLFISNVVGLPDWLRPAVRTEFFIKTGLVILGTGVLFKQIVEAGSYGILQAVLVVGLVWYLCFWICKKMGVDDEFAAMLSSAVSICGVSAAIATSGAIKGDTKKLSYVTSLVLICAIPMLIFQPMIAKWCNIPDIVAGAWLGGTLDTSGSVVAAGALISDAAMKTGVIVKMSQNVLIGVAAFILSVVWTYKSTAPGQEKPGLGEIWERFPKFVLGFMAASLLYSFFLPGDTVKATGPLLRGLTTWWFALTFTSIGLETNFGDILRLGGYRPAVAFVIAQTINVVWTLVLAYLFFGGILFPVPDIK